MEKALTVGGSNVTAVGNLQNVQKVRNMLHVLQSNVVKRLAIAFREWNNYLILKKIIEKEKIKSKLIPSLILFLVLKNVHHNFRNI